MSAKNDLTAEAVFGYASGDNKHLYSSPSWYAHELGRYFQRTGRPTPRDVRMGRGYSIHANDMLFRITGTRQEDMGFERLK